MHCSKGFIYLPVRTVLIPQMRKRMMALVSASVTEPLNHYLGRLL